MMLSRRISLHGPSMIAMVVCAALIAGCFGQNNPPVGEPPVGEPTIDPAAYTQSAATIIAELTLNAPPTAEPQAAPSLTPTEEPLPPTSTPLPTNTPLPSDTPLPTNTPLPTDTPIPLESPTATTPPEPQWQLNYFDDFNAARFWATDTGGLFRMRYSGGGYRIESQAVSDIIYSTRSGEYAGVRLETLARRVSGPTDAYFGVICNFVNGGNYYMMAVGADGWYGIVKKEMMQTIFLAEGIDTSGAIQSGLDGVTVRGDCANGQLTLWANGVRLASVRDVSFTRGTVGVGVGSRRTSNVEVHFDDFYLYTIPAQPVMATAPGSTGTATAAP